MRLVALVIALAAAGCSGAPHDLDLEELEGEVAGLDDGVTAGSGSSGSGATSSAAAGGGAMMNDAVSWSVDVAPAILGTNCTQSACHDAAATSGQYSLTSRDNALGAGSDGTIPNVLPGDAGSLLITKCTPTHNNCALQQLFYAWIVDNDAAP
jgi:hypothetical protein